MKGIIYLLIVLFLNSCNSPTLQVTDIQIRNNVLNMDIENNSDQDYYILNPSIHIYIDGGANMVNTELISHHIKSDSLDQIICKVFPSDCIVSKDIPLQSL